MFASVIKLNAFEYTVKLQWLEQAWDHKKIVLAKGSSSHPGWIMYKMNRHHDDSAGQLGSQSR